MKKQLALLMTIISSFYVNAEVQKPNLILQPVQVKAISGSRISFSWQSIPADDRYDDLITPYTAFGIFLVQGVDQTRGRCLTEPMAGPGNFRRCVYMTAMNTTAASVPRSWRAFQAQWARGYGESGSGVADMQTEAIVDWSSIYLCAGAIRGSINGVYMSYYPSLGCISVRPPNVSCTFSASSLVLDHGTLSEQSINGNKATSNINIQCNNAATYKANISNTDVDLGGGVRSTVAFDGYANNANVSVANSKVLTLSSTLRTSGSVTPGEHTGNTVILFSIQ